MRFTKNSHISQPHFIDLFLMLSPVTNLYISVTISLVSRQLPTMEP